MERGYTGWFSIITDRATGSQAVRIGSYTENDYVPKDEVKIPEELLPDGHYPVNSKGETYGNAFGTEFLGYLPDLVGVQATNGKGGYALRRELDFGDYPGDTDTLEGFEEFFKWRETQPNPRQVKVYDVNRDNIIGYFEVGKGTSSNDLEGVDLETAREEIKNNRWGVPANPIPGGTRIPAADEQDMRDLILYLRLDRGYTGTLGREVDDVTGKRAVLFPFDCKDKYVAKEDIKVPKGLLSDGSYPVNSRGETYGTVAHEGFLGYWPDLISVVATNGKGGYALKTDFDYFDIHDWAKRNHKTSSDYDEWLKLNEEYKAWAGTQPSIKEIPVYDADRNNILGYYRIGNDFGYDYTISQEEIQERLDTIADHFRRVEGYSEEQIAQLLEEYKQSQGWS